MNEDLIKQMDAELSAMKQPDYGSMSYIAAKLDYMQRNGAVDNDWFRDNVFQPAQLKRILAKENKLAVDLEKPMQDLDDVAIYMDGKFKDEVERVSEQIVEMCKSDPNFITENREELINIGILREVPPIANYDSMPRGMKEAQQANGVRDHGLNLQKGDFEWENGERDGKIIFVSKEDGKFTVGEPTLIEGNKAMYTCGIDPYQKDGVGSEAVFIKYEEGEAPKIINLSPKQQIEEFDIESEDKGQEELFGEIKMEGKIAIPTNIKDLPPPPFMGMTYMEEVIKNDPDVKELDNSIEKITPMLNKALQQSEPSNEMISERPEPKLGYALTGEFPTTKWAHIFREHSTGAMPMNDNFQIIITILGEPTAQKRHKGRNMGKLVQQYDPSAADKADFLSLIHKNAPAVPFDCPLRLDAFFYFGRPKAHYRSGANAHLLKPNAPTWKTSKPDRDNLDKFVMDSMKGVYFRDDSIVCAGEIIKKYDINPRTEIIITVL